MWTELAWLPLDGPLSVDFYAILLASTTHIYQITLSRDATYRSLTGWHHVKCLNIIFRRTGIKSMLHLTRYFRTILISTWNHSSSGSWSFFLWWLLGLEWPELDRPLGGLVACIEERSQQSFNSYEDCHCRQLQGGVTKRLQEPSQRRGSLIISEGGYSTFWQTQNIFSPLEGLILDIRSMISSLLLFPCCYYSTIITLPSNYSIYTFSSSLIILIFYFLLLTWPRPAAKHTSWESWWGG